MSEQEKPDAAAEIRRIHAMITQALDESLEQSEHFAQAGFPDAETRQVLVGYVGCFGGMLHAHHVSEDEFVFPYLWDQMPDAPLDTLIAQHQEMEPLLGSADNVWFEALAKAPADWQGPQDPKLVKRVHDIFLRGRVHKLKFQ